jgi:hypothetical protein
MDAVNSTKSYIMGKNQILCYHTGTTYLKTQIQKKILGKKIIYNKIFNGYIYGLPRQSI